VSLIPSSCSHCEILRETPAIPVSILANADPKTMRSCWLILEIEPFEAAVRHIFFKVYKNHM
jgi:hypothetical protein